MLTEGMINFNAVDKKLGVGVLGILWLKEGGGGGGGGGGAL